MRYRAVAIALVAALPPVLLVMPPLSRTLRHLSDPCVQWGVSFSGSVTLAVPPGRPCRAIESTSETRAQAVVRIILVHGGILIASALGLLGAWFARPFISVIAAGLMLLESVPLMFSFGWLAAFVSGLFLAAARDSGPVERTAELGMRVIGSLGGIGALLFLPTIVSRALFLVFSCIALAFVAVVGWWPEIRKRLTRRS